ncbi:hypothetical protein [Lacihabitans soyangensis]|jgi:hypothetical protein|uniref:Peptidylprolyl isomerase n=1 Tax=Lacihabitans soyangensis TaxID=869394 RepID=A0AAE3H4C8_9BACT|nr:hypothetical protein [Lacihabitans soyangensis]MCP9764732.1 hypothetical protein [Lacihabitans soyangensis]
MKKQFKAVILALVFGTVSGNAQVSYANNISGDRLAVNSATEFSTFVKAKARKVSRKNDEDLKKYLEVVNLYHNSSVAFYNLSDAQKAEFMEASATLSDKLSGMSRKEAKAWSQKVQLNKSVFEFIWSSKNTISTESEVSEVPAVVDAVTSL